MPDRPIPSQPNLVTPEGLVRIDEMVDRLEEEHATARANNDVDAVARTARDLRYWSAQRANARVLDAPTSTAVVEFGSTVVVARSDGRKQTFRVVGIDEANPAAGTLSHILPLARALLGRSPRDVTSVGDSSFEILEIR